MESDSKDNRLIRIPQLRLVVQCDHTEFNEKVVEKAINYLKRQSLQNVQNRACVKLEQINLFEMFLNNPVQQFPPFDYSKYNLT